MQSANKKESAESIKLFGLHIPGPGDLYAIPSKEIGEKVALHFNDNMRATLGVRLSAMSEEQRKYSPPLECCLAVVIEWPFDADSHAEHVADFDVSEFCNPDLVYGNE